MEIKLPQSVLFILNRLKENGHRGDIVGGPVRDYLLGKTPSDFDITTDASPARIKEIFSDFRTVDTGIAHGTVTVVISGESFEITTYRIDGEYKDSRHPESVSFTTELSEDLARRDFTVNAMAYNPEHGITDCYGGREDLENKLIRAVGDPRVRFSEDALRILRGARFASVLGFKIEEKTDEAMRELCGLLKNVSVERIFTEWRKLISGESAYSVIRDYRDLIGVFLPELCEDMPDESRFNAAQPLVRMISLFYSKDGGGGNRFLQATRRLHTDNRTREVGVIALDDGGRIDTSSAFGIKLGMSEYGEEAVRVKIELEILLGIRDSSAKTEWERIITQKEPYRISDLDISGNDLVAQGLRGASVGAAMKGLLVAVMKGELENNRAALIKHLADNR